LYALKPIADIPNQQAAEAMAAQQGQSSNPATLFSSTTLQNKSICGTISLVASEAWYGLDLFSRSQGASASGAQFGDKVRTSPRDEASKRRVDQL
jgi:hypothetical protein